MSIGLAHRARLMVRLSRPRFLLVGFILYVFGSLLAWDRAAAIDLARCAFGFLVFAPAYVAVSFVNDYFDRDLDKGKVRTSYSGGSGVLVEEPSMAKTALRFAIAATSLTVVLSVVFAFVYQMPLYFVPFVTVGALLGWFYSAPPIRFVSRGLGEASTAIASGLVLPGMAYLSNFGAIDVWFLVLSLPLICYGLFFILTVEAPDEENDKTSGKPGFVARHGMIGAGRLAVLAPALGTLGLFVLVFLSPGGEYLFLAPLVPLSLGPLLAGIYWWLRTPTSPRSVERQVVANFASVLIFIAMADMYLALIV